MRRSPVSLLLMLWIGLSAASPFLASIGGDYSDPATRHGFFYGWFYVLPTVLDQLVWPESDATMLLLATAVYLVQYAAVMLVLLLGWVLVKPASAEVLPKGASSPC